VTKVCRLLLFFLTQWSFGAIIEYHIDTQSRLGYHLVSPVDMSSHRHELETNAIIRVSPQLSFGLGGQAFVEAAYAANTSRYPDPIKSRDSQDFILRDLYLQYKSGPLTMKLGNQQVVWGEAFGFYYADLVNPKDFREFGIGPLDKNRLQTPMANLKWNFNDNILQFLVIPRPFFNKSPAIRSDFAFPFSKFFPGSSVVFNDERTPSIAHHDAEYGFRVSPSIVGTDFSLIYFNYSDRAPVYVSTPPGAQVQITGKHLKMETFGATLSMPLKAFVLRSELLYHRKKNFNLFDGTFNTFISDQAVGVLGLDYIVGDKWRIGVQLSENYRTLKFTGALDPASSQLVTGHGSFTLFHDNVFDILVAYSPNDGSNLTELSWTVPVSKRAELVLASDLFNGGGTSQFGLYHPASRGYVQLRTFLGGDSRI
jgi:hypothetical protein